ncbi:MAG: hypothetical protein HQM06_17810 [Magnetococcales bacterium]|nr:hypothetical protein [Magnetococcales bacterium]
MRLVRPVREFFGSFLAYGTRVPRERWLSLATEIFTRLTATWVVPPGGLPQMPNSAICTGKKTCNMHENASRQTKIHFHKVDKIRKF